MASRPALDFSKFTHGSHLDKLKLDSTSVKSFKDHSFIRLISHGLSDATSETLLESVRRPCRLVSKIRFTNLLTY